MTDSWGFLLQTLTASGAAVLLLAVKAMFRDKLSPRWQFGVWGILALVLLIPAGWGGRYALLNWPLLVEVLKSQLTGDFASVTRVYAPVPLPTARAVGDWFFLLHMAVVALLLGRYLLAYFRLRQALRQGQPAGAEVMAQVRRVAAQYGLAVPEAVQMPRLSSAFVCGVWRPVLALPAATGICDGIDDKIILHELLHLKYHDVVWGWLIALLRCLHWCNPLLWFCADRAGNDLEALCDQRVLERLAGEERRDYGRILLTMASDKNVRLPGTSSIANGGRNIRRRIEAIARFKQYPAGMKLPALCIGVLLAAPLVFGAQAQAQVAENVDYGWQYAARALAEARLTGCTTYAGAFDCYAKALLAEGRPESCYYRALCAPMADLNDLAAEMAEISSRGYYTPNLGLPAFAEASSGYQVYSLREGYDAAGLKSFYEGLLVVELASPPEGFALQDPEHCLLAAQRVRVEQQQGRWVALPQEDFWLTESRFDFFDLYGDDSLPPTRCYAVEYGDFRLELRHWATYCVPRDFSGTDIANGLPALAYFNGGYVDPIPQPNGSFDCGGSAALVAVYTGAEADKAQYKYIGASLRQWPAGQEQPQLPGYSGTALGGGTTAEGVVYGFCQLEPGWDNLIYLNSSGGTSPEEWPDRYVLNFYLNGQRVAEGLQLLPEAEGGEQNGGNG